MTRGQPASGSPRVQDFEFDKGHSKLVSGSQRVLTPTTVASAQSTTQRIGLSNAVTKLMSTPSCASRKASKSEVLVLLKDATLSAHQVWACQIDAPVPLEFVAVVRLTPRVLAMTPTLPASKFWAHSLSALFFFHLFRDP